MPFKELGTHNVLWGRIGDRQIALCKTLRDKYFKTNTHFVTKVRVFFDEESNLIGLQSDNNGYSFNDEKISIRVIPKNIPKGRYEAYFDDNHDMVIIDLNKPITIF